MSNSAVKYTRQQKIVLVCLFSGQFMVNTCLSTPAPFLPKENELHNVSSSVTGWMLGTFSLVQIIFSSVWGKLLPHTGTKTNVVFGCFFAGGSTVLFGFVLRAAQSIGCTAFITAAMTLISVTFPDNTTTILSYSETLIGLGVMGGPAIGSGLFKLGGFKLPFFGLGGLMIVSSVFMYIFLPSGLVSHSHHDALSVRQILASTKVMCSMAIALYAGASWASFDPILEPELRKKYGIPNEISALVFLILSGIYILTAPVLGKCIEKEKCVDSFTMMILGSVIGAIFFLLAGPSPLMPFLERPMWLLLVCLGGVGFALALLIIPSLDISFGIDYGTEVDSASTNSLISGLWMSFYAFGETIGESVSGVSQQYAGFDWTMTYYAFLSMAMAVLVVIVKIYLIFANNRKRMIERTDLDKDERRPLLNAQV